MSSSIPVGFAIRFRDDIIMLSQQKTSRLLPFVRTDPDSLQGKFGYFDRMGAIAMQERTTRHADTGLVEPAHSRRRVTLRDFELPQLLDKQDVIRMVANPQGKYLQNALMAANRKKDDLIIAAALGNAYSIDENDSASTVSFPSGQIVAAAASGLTLTKVLTAKEIIDGNDVDEEIPRFAFVSAKQVTNLLNTTEIKSSDYNTVKALAEGRVDTFLGFKFIRTERLAKSSTTRKCIFGAQGAVGLAVGEDIMVDIGPRRDKGNATQVLVTLSADAARIEDEKIVEVDCTET